VSPETQNAFGRRHVLQDLGWVVARDGDHQRGTATIYPEMHVPGTGHVRTSILATWADVLSGYLAMDVLSPRVPVTLELDVHLFGPPPGTGSINGIGRVLKAGRTVFVARVDFFNEEEADIGFAAASFMAAPDTALTIARDGLERPAPQGKQLHEAFADRAGCQRREPGVAVLSSSDESLNASNTLNGGLIALAVEEAVLSLSPGQVLTSLALRYLQPVRMGPAVARATVQRDLAQVEVRDAGNDDRLCVVATARTEAA
jgi:acyl-coenzyme A thioesterase PaaI-like protein